MNYLPPEELKQGRGSWTDSKSRSIWPLKKLERFLFRDIQGFREMIRKIIISGYHSGEKVPEEDEMRIEQALDYQRLEFRKRSNAIIGQTIEFMNYIFRFSWARREGFPEEYLLIELLKAVIWAYLQKYYRQPWDELPTDKLIELEDRANELTYELTSKIKWPDQRF